MKIEIQAAQRLAAAYADTEAAKAYIKSLGVKTMSFPKRKNGLISYVLEDGQDIDNLLLSISKALGTKPKKSKRPAEALVVYTWIEPKNRVIRLEAIDRDGDYPLIPSVLTLEDSN